MLLKTPNTGHLSLNKGKLLEYTGQSPVQLIEPLDSCQSVFPKPTSTKPATTAKIIGKNLIAVVIQFWILAAFADIPDIHINHVETPNEISTNQYHSI
jgi:hypothetical protein